MKGLGIAVVALVLSSAAPAFAQQNGIQRGPPGGHGGHSGQMGPGVRPGQRPMVVRGWRHVVPGVHFARHRAFRFRGHTFLFVGAPLFASPWVYYPYTWDAQWGPRYYDPAQPGDFLFFCPEPAGYYPEVSDCPAGWWPAVPNEPVDEY